MCVVEIQGAKALMPACATKVRAGMEVLTDSETVLAARRQTLDRICTRHRMDCETCPRYSDCELHALLRDYHMDDRVYMRQWHAPEPDRTAPHLVRDASKCVQCLRCVSTCEKVQGIGAIRVSGRGDAARVGPAAPPDATACVQCGQCITACPTGALSVRDDTHLVWQALSHQKKVLAVVSPFAAARLGEFFGEALRPDDGGRLAALLREIGFFRVCDAQPALDAMRSRNLAERAARQAAGNRAPLLSAACPAFVRMCEREYPAMTGLLSAMRSPMQWYAGECRSQFSAKEGLDKAEVLTVLITPCTAEKALCGPQGADAALTAAECAGLILRACVSRYTAHVVWHKTAPQAFDALPQPAGPAAQGADRIQVFGLAGARRMLDHIAGGADALAGEYIELFACPGGCENGGGQKPRGADARSGVPEAEPAR
jgi:NADP-reducing hydrogenase subunit HndD